MNDRIKLANEWRRDMVSRLVAACRSDEAAPIDTAMLAVSIPACSPGDTGFSLSDLRFYSDRLIDRADQIEMQVADRAGKLSWMKRKAEHLAEKAGRVTEKSRRVGGTVSRTEYATVRDEARAATADVESIKVKIAGLTETLDRMTAEADALRGAAALLGDLIDARTARRTEALKGAPITVDVA
jgi:hypothetical protein